MDKVSKEASKALADKKKKRDKDGSKQRLLEAALQIFSSRGYDAATTREIAATAGMSEVLIQRYFDGKAGLLLAIMNTYACQQEQEACSLVREGQSFRAEIESFFQTLLSRGCRDNAFHKVLLSRAVVDENVGRELQKHCYESSVSTLKKRMKHFQGQGKLRKGDDAEALALAIAISGFAMNAVGKVIFQLDDETVLKASKALSKVIARGLEAED